MLVTMTRLRLAIIFNDDSYMCARCYRIGFFLGSFFGFFFANWSLVACSDNSAKKDVMPYDCSFGDGDTEGTVNVLLLHYDWLCAYIDARY